MDDLAAARAEINEVDRAMAALFSRRMAAVAQVAAYKAQHGKAIYDPEREAQVIARNSELVEEDLRPYYVKSLENTMAVSRAYQQDLIGQ